MGRRPHYVPHLIYLLVFPIISDDLPAVEAVMRPEYSVDEKETSAYVFIVLFGFTVFRAEMDANDSFGFTDVA